MRAKKGTVVSKSGEKSIVVEVHTYVMHSKYQKRFRRSKKFHAHDAENKKQVGDDVIIVETRPLSKLKRWRLATTEEISELS